MEPERGEGPLRRATLAAEPLEGGDGGGQGDVLRRRAERIEGAFEIVKVSSVLLWLLSAVLAAHAVTDGRPELHRWSILGLIAALAVHRVGRAWAADALRDVAVSAGADGAAAGATAEQEIAQLELRRVHPVRSRTKSTP